MCRDTWTLNISHTHTFKDTATAHASYKPLLLVSIFLNPASSSLLSQSLSAAWLIAHRISWARDTFKSFVIAHCELRTATCFPNRGRFAKLQTVIYKSYIYIYIYIYMYICIYIYIYTVYSRIYLGVDGWIILGWISRRWDVGMWTGLGWHRLGTGGGRLWVRWRTFGFHKMRGISWLAANQLPSKEGLFSME